jgi:predicted 2-oxoglutarate/Fe(II)-dependent dioxygenase YbiX
MYVLADVPKDILEILDDVIKEKALSPINGDLAGNIKHEYSIPKGKAAVSPMLMHMVVKHKEKYPNFFKKAHSTLNYKACEVELFNLWVNFQKKYEFNPPHVHDGLFSFVIWHKVPFKMEDERARLPNISEDAIAFILYLNDEFDGGETVFENETTIKPKKGRLLVFSNGIILHKVNLITKGERYALAGWFK